MKTVNTQPVPATDILTDLPEVNAALLTQVRGGATDNPYTSCTPGPIFDFPKSPDTGIYCPPEEIYDLLF